MFLVHEPEALFLYHCSEEKKSSLGQWKRKGFWCESGLGLNPSSATYKLCELGVDDVTSPSLNFLLCKLGMTQTFKILYAFWSLYI